MFDVVAMIPGVRRKPARLYCGGRTLQPFDFDDEVGVLLGRTQLQTAKINSSSSWLTSPPATIQPLQGGRKWGQAIPVLVWADTAWLELP